MNGFGIAKQNVFGVHKTKDLSGLGVFGNVKITLPQMPMIECVFYKETLSGRWVKSVSVEANKC